MITPNASEVLTTARVILSRVYSKLCPLTASTSMWIKVSKSCSGNPLELSQDQLVVGPFKLSHCPITNPILDTLANARTRQAGWACGLQHDILRSSSSIMVAIGT